MREGDTGIDEYQQLLLSVHNMLVLRYLKRAISLTLHENVGVFVQYHTRSN